MESENVEFSDEAKQMLDERLETDESLFVPATEAINKLAGKYSIN